MTDEEKKTLIDAVNCKYPHQNLTEIYYNIGRALPFTAQRFPDGRVSDWYRNQYVEVVQVKPHGKGGSMGMYWVFISVMAKGQMSMIMTLKTVGVQRMPQNHNLYHVAGVAHGCCWTSKERR